MYNRKPRPTRLAACVAFALLAWAGWPTAALSQAQPAPANNPAPPATILTLRDAAQLAVLKNPEVLARWHTMRAAEAERDVARGALLPRVDLSSGYGTERRNDVTANNRAITSLSLSQLLYDGFATRNEVRRLDQATRVRLFEFFDVSETAALEASRAWFDVLRFRELLKLAEDNFVEHRTVFDQTERRVNARIARAVDLEQVTGRLALAEANLLTETANLHDTSARFQRVIGRLPPPAMPLPPLMVRDIPAGPAEAVGVAQVRNAALRAAVENVRASKAALETRKGAYQPRFDLRLRRDQGSNLPPAFGTNGNASVAEVVLSWNLFSGFSDVSRERQFAEQLNVAMDVRDKTCRDIRQTLVIAHNDIRKLTDQLVHLELHQAAVGRALVAYRQQFDIGQRSLLDLLDTENELFQARRAVVNARYDLNLAYARTQAGLGNLLRTLELANLDAGELTPASQAWGPGDEAAADCPLDTVAVPSTTRDSLLQRVSDRAAARPAQALAPPATAAPAPVAPAVPGRAPQAVERAILSSLENWRRAWAARDLPSYLASYAPAFQPAEGVPRSTWEQRRRAIIGKADAVSLELSGITVSVQGADRATTVFNQSYRSASYRDSVAKTIEWQRVGDEWKIVRESSSPAPNR
ncbi:MAG: TolC family outer membrane protein [Burkholderiales bacterium]|nr:TolC family outer membrane protein [Burkholderiales bacterium]